MSKLFTKQDCVHISSIRSHYKNQVLVMKPIALSAQFQKREFQLWKAIDGPGCDPSNVDTSVHVTCLADGENCRFERYDFIGVVKPKILETFKAENPDLLTWDHDPKLPDQLTVPSQTS